MNRAPAPEFSFLLYSLIPRASLSAVAQASSRQGALLKFCFEDGKIGYADCFPWPELGDLTLEDQIRLLREGQFTSLTERSFEFARIDAIARASQLSLFDNLSVPPSHFLLSDLRFWVNDSRKSQECLFEDLHRAQFDRIKIKMGRDVKGELRALLSLVPKIERYNFKVRLDFNGSLTFSEVSRFLSGLGEAKSLIDFIEDPIPFDSNLWAEIQSRWKVRLALDRVPFKIGAGQLNFNDDSSFEGAPDGDSKNPVAAFVQSHARAFSVFILKPAVQDPRIYVPFAEKCGVPIVVTSYLDHPLGQLCAAWAASQIVKEGRVPVETCGFLSQSAYLPHPFSDSISSCGPTLVPSSGPGFGVSF